MDKDRNHMTEKILKLTLEIIYLLTGEDYVPVNNSNLHVTRSISHKFGRSCGSLTVDHSSSGVHDKKNDEKILDLTNKIIHVLNGEVPIRYEDIMVCFTMEEWEYVEGHKDLYKNVLMEDQSLDTSKVLNREETEVEDEQSLPSPPSSNKDANDIEAKAGRKGSKWRKPRKRRAKYLSKHKDKLAAFKNLPKEDKLPENIGSFTNDSGSFTTDAAYSGTNTHSPCLSSEIRPVNENYTSSDQTQGEYTTCQAEQHLPSSGENYTGDDEDVKSSHPELLSCIREPPIDTFPATSSTQVQYVFTNIKEEAEPTEADSYGHTQYPSTDCQEESWQETNDTGANTYAVGHTQYTLAHVKKEYVLCEEETIHIPTRSIPKQVKVEPISHEDGYELYIPTDFTQRLHTSAPGQAMNRVRDAAKTNKKNSITKYKDWNKTPENSKNSPHMNHRPTQVVDGMYVCSTCGKSFTSHFGLVKHQAMHNGNKVSCPQCGKLFFYKSSLVIHQRIHTGEKLFSCPVCNKCFTNNSNLIVHQRIHTGEKPFVCSECGKSFGHKGHLNRHLRTHEIEKPTTNIENYVSSLQDNWDSHKMNGWSHDIYNTSPYSTYDKSV